MKTKVIELNPRDPDLTKIKEIAETLKQGKVVAFPTETVYGLGALASRPEAVVRIFKIKNRDKAKPLTLHIASDSFLEKIEIQSRETFDYLRKKFWPGPLTIILATKDGVKYGLRFPNHTIARLLILFAGEPILATSANLSGTASPVEAKEVLEQLDGKIDILMDGGRTDYAQDSSIADISHFPYKIVRQGVNAARIEEILTAFNTGRAPKQKLLLVCTGNTCRSPMAEGWLKREIERKEMGHKIELVSSGVFGLTGCPPTSEAIEVVKEEGIDISSHRGQKLTMEMVKDADLIIVMSEEHKKFILTHVPEATGKIKLLGIADPIGKGLETYRECFSLLKQRLKEELDWLKD